MDKPSKKTNVRISSKDSKKSKEKALTWSFQKMDQPFEKTDDSNARDRSATEKARTPKGVSKQEKALTWSFQKIEGSDGNISMENRSIDVEWLGRHFQLIADQRTYEDLVAVVAKEFHIDLEFLSEMFLEFSFKGLNPYGKKKRITEENFASEFKKVKQLYISIVDQALQEEKEAS